MYRNANRFSSAVHKKETFSGVYTHFKSFLPEEYEKGLLLTLIYRAYEKLCGIFLKNGYQLKFIDKCGG